MCRIPSSFPSSGVIPKNVPPGSVSEIVVTGSGFSPSELLSCIFRLGAGTNDSSAASTNSETVAVLVTQARLISSEAVACTTAPVVEAILSPPSSTPGTFPSTVQVGVSNSGAETDGSWTDLVLSDAPVLERATPAAGPTAGCTTVTVRGHGFLDSPDLLCAFGTTTTSAVFVNSGEISCRTPQDRSEERDFPVRAALTVSNNGVDYSKLALGFYFIPAPMVSSIYPRVVTVEDVENGRSVVNIYGTGFVQYVEEDSRLGVDNSRSSGAIFNTTCRFAGIGDSLAVVVLPTMITCPMPPASASVGVVVVTVSVNGQDFPASESGLTLAIVSAPLVGSLFPTMGPSSGGTTVQVSADNVSAVDPLVCAFQFVNDTRVDVPAEYDGRGFVSCTTPAFPSVELGDTITDRGIAVALVYVTVASTSLAPKRDIGSMVDSAGTEFIYFATPTVSHLDPKTGAPGTVVDVIGEGFLDAPGLSCRFGGTIVVMTFKSVNLVTCKAPREMIYGSTVAVEVSNNMVDWTSNGVAFTYRPRSIIDSITPKVGPVSGSTIVRVAGFGLPEANSSNGFDVEISCRFGSTLVGATPAVDGELFCVSPAIDQAGSVSLEIVEGETDLTDSGWRFHYVPDVEVSGAYPLTGPEMGGTAVAITGSQFLGLEPVVCQFGVSGFRAAGHWLSRTVFVCHTPPQRPGIAPLAISTNGQQFTDTGLTYTYQPEAAVSSISPRSGSVHGGTYITVSGAGFLKTADMACLVGDRLGEAAYIDPTMVRCSVPRAEIQDRGSSAAVRIANNGVDFTDSRGVFFEYVPYFDLRSIEPTVGSTEGGTLLRVHGVGFDTAGNVSCVVNGSIVQTLVETARSLTCTAPMAVEAGEVKVELTINGEEMSSSTASFRYHWPVEVTSVYPISAPESGGSRLLVTGSGFTDTGTLACVFVLSPGRHETQIMNTAVYLSDNVVSCSSPKGGVGDAEVRVTNNGIDVSVSLVYFTVTSKSTVTMLWPSSGWTDGGTAVRVEGTGFVDLSTVFCRFGDAVVSADTVLDFTSVMCTSPPREESGGVAVEVTNNGVDWTSSGVVFAYLPPIKVLGVSPNIGPLGGGTVVRLSGSGFEASTDGGKLACRFGLSVVPAVVTEAGSIALCVAPASPKLGYLSLDISSNGVEFMSVGYTFYYSQDIVAESAWPLAGPESGGTVVTITGAGFTDTREILCEFESVETLVPGTWVDSSTLSCISPRHMPGVVPLRLSMNRQQFVETGLSFEYLVQSTVRTITPSSGPPHGGTLVEVAGTAFVNSTALSCHFGSRSLPAVFVDSEHLRCTTPPSVASARLSLEISNNGVDYTNSGAKFTVVPALNIRYLWPTSGPVMGGTKVVVHGSGFSGGTNVLCIFDGRETLATVRSDGELDCPTPGRDATGLVRVELTNNGVDKVSSSIAFTYVDPIRLTDVSPARSGEEGGATVVVSGHNFIASPSLSCRFGRQEATPALWISFTRISCLTPSSPAGPGDISLSVSNNGQDFTGGSLLFTFVPAFTVMSSQPRTGPVDGGTEVTLMGTGLGETGPWACVFGEAVAVLATQLPSGHLRCKSPPQPPGRVPLRVFRSASPLGSAVSGAVAAASTGLLRDFGLTFEYQGTVFLSSVEPRSGSTSGGTPVTLRGFGFANASMLTCGFSEQNGRFLMSPAVQTSGSMAVCSSPPLTSGKGYAYAAGPSVVTVTVSLNGADFTRRGLQYTYYQPVEVLGLFPAMGSTSGGTVVTIVGRRFFPSEALSCRFGAFAASPGEFLSSDAVRCIAPPSPHGPTDVIVTVTNNLADFSESSAIFEYRPQVRPERFYPTFGPLSGGTVVTIEGGAFFATPQLACRFGGVVAKANLESRTSVTCQAPKSSVEKEVLLQLTVNGMEWEDVQTTNNPGVFTYYRPPKVTMLHPSTGPQEGGTHLSIFGRFLEPVLADGPILCRMGNVSAASQHVFAALTWESSDIEGVEDYVVCRVPDLSAHNFMGVEVAVSTDGGRHFSSPGLVFTYLQVRNRAIGRTLERR